MPKPLLPPTYFLASLALMGALAFALPIAPLLAWPWRALGVVPVAAGVWLNLAADRAFKARGTTVKPFQRSSAPAGSSGGRFESANHCRPIGASAQRSGAWGETKAVRGRSARHWRPSSMRSFPSAP